MKNWAQTAKKLFVTIAVSISACGAREAQAETFKVSAPVPILTTKQMTTMGIYYPDGAIGVLRKGNGTYNIFGAGGSLGGIGPGVTIEPPGTYKFGGSLANFAPSQLSGGFPTPSLQWGRVQPSPDGSDFDRDYAGGGPTYLFDIGGPTLLQIYHGEYHYNYPASLPFYGGSGMAVSTNDGASFTKIGEFLSPHLTQAEFLALGTGGGLPVDGFMIQADINGNPVKEGGHQHGDVYYYDIFTDRTSATDAGFAIARVKETDLIEAVAMHKAPPFKKYYAPGGGFTEPGLGGAPTFIVTQNPDFIAWPQAIYCSHLNKFFLFYQTNQNSVQVRTSTNLMTWSSPTTLISSANVANLKTYYPTAVGTGIDPSILANQFYVYFQQRSASGPLNPNYYRATVTVTP
jgi:hypothetical protein